jgi:hypothetical protein
MVAAAGVGGASGTVDGGRRLVVVDGVEAVDGAGGGIEGEGDTVDDEGGTTDNDGRGTTVDEGGGSSVVEGGGTAIDDDGGKMAADGGAATAVDTAPGGDTTLPIEGTGVVEAAAATPTTGTAFVIEGGTSGAEAGGDFRIRLAAPELGEDCIAEDGEVAMALGVLGPFRTPAARGVALRALRRRRLRACSQLVEHRRNVRTSSLTQLQSHTVL